MDNESKWSGKIIIDDNVGKYGKLWNCDIQVHSETAPHIILHEQIHAHSISYYNPIVYARYWAIEESAVQFMAQEISKVEGINIVVSAYDKMVDCLREINTKLKISETDYSFAKRLVEMPVTQRLDWLEERAYNYMQEGGTIEEYQKISGLIKKLEEGDLI